MFQVKIQMELSKVWMIWFFWEYWDLRSHQHAQTLHGRSDKETGVKSSFIYQKSSQKSRPAPPKLCERI